MSRNDKIVPGLLLFTLILFGCAGPVDESAEKAIISQTIHDSIEWALTKDTNKLYGSMIQDSTLLIINPTLDKTRGFQAIVQTANEVWLKDEFKAIRTDITELEIQMSGDGKCAWFFCMLDDIGSWEGKESGWVHTRWTGVLEKIDGKWLIRQMHFSFAYEDMVERIKKRLGK